MIGQFVVAPKYSPQVLNDEAGNTPSVVVARLKAMVPESAASDGEDRIF